MIDFETPAGVIQKQVDLIHNVAVQVMRPISRKYDEHEHDRPWEYINVMWKGGANAGFRGRSAKE